MHCSPPKTGFPGLINGTCRRLTGTGLNGCQNPVFDAAPSLDLTLQVPGIETTVLRYTQCPPGGAVELWTVNNGDHFLFWNNNFPPQSLALVVDWLLAHPKP